MTHVTCGNFKVSSAAEHQQIVGGHFDRCDQKRTDDKQEDILTDEIFQDQNSIHKMSISFKSSASLITIRSPSNTLKVL